MVNWLTRFSDTGVGLCPREQRRTDLQGHCTTKDNGNLAMGLPISRSIIESTWRPLVGCRCLPRAGATFSAVFTLHAGDFAGAPRITPSWSDVVATFVLYMMGYPNTVSTRQSHAVWSTLVDWFMIMF